MKFASHSKPVRILLYIALGLMLAGDAFLIVEACIPSTGSAAQSTFLGSGVASIINEGTDETKIIPPTSVSIESPDASYIPYIGDTYQINATVLPEDSSYKSLTYSSSDESVATVNQSGLVEFLDEGEVTITSRVNYSVSDIHSSLTFSVQPVALESITSTLNNVTLNEDGTYHLTKGQYYSILTEVSPVNATYKDLTYSIDEGYEAYLVGSSVYAAESIEGPITVTVTSVSNPNATSSFSFMVEAAAQEDPVTEIPLTGIDFASTTEATIAIGQSYNLASSSTYKPSFTPSNATNKGYKYEIVEGDSSIATLSGTTLKGVGEGTIKLKLSSTSNPDLYATKDIHVAFVSLTSASIRLSATNLLVNHTATLSSSVSPSNATNYLKGRYGSFVLEDDGDGLVSLSGSTITALKAGSGTIKVSRTYYSDDAKTTVDRVATNTFTLTIKEPSVVSSVNAVVDSSIYEITSPSGQGFLYTDKSYNLASYLNVSYLQEDGTDVDFSESEMSKDYSLSVSSSSGGNVSLDGTTLTLNSSSGYDYSKAHEVTLTLTHTDSAVTCEFTLPFLHPSLVNPDSDPIVGSVVTDNEDYEEVEVSDPSNGTNTLSFGDSSYPMLDYEGMYSGSYYKLDLDPSRTYSISYEEVVDTETSTASNSPIYEQTSFEGSSLLVRSLQPGIFKIKVTPTYTYNDETFEIDALSEVVYIQAIEYYCELSDFELSVFDMDAEALLEKTSDESQSGDGYLFEGDRTYNMSAYLSGDYQIRLSKPEEAKVPTAYGFTVTSSNEAVASISSVSNLEEGLLGSYYINLKKVGNVTLTISEIISGKSCTLSIKVKNKVTFSGGSEDATFTLSQKGYTDFGYNEEDGTWHIKNGVSAKLVTNFDEDATYKTVTYTSSNTEVLTIGSDGTITPLMIGTSVITANIDDGDTIDVTYQLKITVDRTPAIEDINAFLIYFRKLVGHFGAFMLLACAATPFFLVAFDKKKWLYSAPAAVGHGLLLAVTTELIQLFVPGRSGNWKDVWTDFRGYLYGFLFCALIVAIVYGTSYLIKRHKEKKLKEIQNQTSANITDDAMETDDNPKE